LIILIMFGEEYNSIMAQIMYYLCI
jgi:hypothetical protein